MDIILEHKFAIQIEKESAWAMGGHTLGGTLYLVGGGVIFSTQENFLYRLGNNKKTRGILRPNDLKNDLLASGPLKDCLVITLDELLKAETGSFKQLGISMTYTLRLYLKDGKKYIFVMGSKELADQFVAEISKLLG